MTDVLDKLSKSNARHRSNENDNRLSEKMRLFRVEMGLTQKELAENASIGLAQVRKLEQGQTNASLTTLLKICNVLRVEIDLVKQS